MVSTNYNQQVFCCFPSRDLEHRTTTSTAKHDEPPLFLNKQYGNELQLNNSPMSAFKQLIHVTAQLAPPP